MSYMLVLLTFVLWHFLWQDSKEQQLTLDGWVVQVSRVASEAQAPREDVREIKFYYAKWYFYVDSFLFFLEL